jgi:uroporphyrinogen-III synthase
VALRLIVTRPAAQAADWVRQLAALGLQANALPLIGIAPLADLAPLRAAWQTLSDCRLVVFVSPNAVQQFFAALTTPAPWPAGVLAGSTGPGTTAALRQGGVPAAQIIEPAAEPAQFDSEALWACLQTMDWTAQRVRVVRGEDGRDWLADVLRERGAQLEFLAAYRRVPPQLDDAGRALLAAACSQPAQHLWLFSSSQAVGWLRSLAPAADWSRSLAVASHPRIAQAARDLGFGQVQFSAPTVQAVAQTAVGLVARDAFAATGPSIESRPL